MMMSDADWRWWTIEHTADLAIEVQAASLQLLFEGAAHGTTGVLLGGEGGVAGPSTAVTSVWRDISLRAADREALLVDWLGELLYIQLSDGLLFAAAEIEELGETALVARAGFTLPSNGAVVQRELKGVTYHDLEVSRDSRGWFARVVFDI